MLTKLDEEGDKERRHNIRTDCIEARLINFRYPIRADFDLQNRTCTEIQRIGSIYHQKINRKYIY